MHINNSSYLNYTREAFYSYLGKSGFSLSDLLKKKTAILPEKIIVKYFRQQTSGTDLTIQSRIFKNSSQKVILNQKLFNQDVEACNFQTRINISEREILDFIPSLKEDLESYDIPDFQNKSKRSLYSYKIRHIDLNVFSECSESVLWRLCEESRWQFFIDSGLSLKKLYDADMSLFWIEGAYEYYNPVDLGDDVEVYTWVNRFDKVRVYISQEILSGGKRILITEGQFLLVSLSKGKPLRLTEQIMHAFSPFTENNLVN